MPPHNGWVVFVKPRRGLHNGGGVFVKFGNKLLENPYWGWIWGGDKNPSKSP